MKRKVAPFVGLFSEIFHSAKLTIMLNLLDVYDTSLQDSRAGDG